MKGASMCHTSNHITCVSDLVSSTLLYQTPAVIGLGRGKFHLVQFSFSPLLVDMVALG